MKTVLREIVFDTETTGLSPENGDRLVEIGAVELINHIPTGRTYHQYINPERSVTEEVVAVHGLTEEFLKDYPVFAEVAAAFVEFVGEDGVLVAHNASFDIKFINFELKKLGRAEYEWDRVVDTLEIARKKFPGAKNNLDALCKRFNIDNSHRTKHGALLDAELLADVYLELLGGAEPSMLLKPEEESKPAADAGMVFAAERKVRPLRVFAITPEEEAEHLEFLQNKLKNALWLSEPAGESENKA